MVNVRNHRHIADVVFLVHQLAQLVDGKLHHGCKSPEAVLFPTTTLGHANLGEKEGERLFRAA